MKRVTVEATFPEMRGTYLYKTGRGQGSNSRIATAAAFRNLFSQVKKQRISIIKATITIINVVSEGGEPSCCQEKL